MATIRSGSAKAKLPPIPPGSGNAAASPARPASGTAASDPTRGPVNDDGTTQCPQHLGRVMSTAAGECNGLLKQLTQQVRLRTRRVYGSY